jgi:hypothetical protein
MEQVLFNNGIINYRGYDYTISFLEMNGNEMVYVNLVNDPYTFTVVLVANETTINGILQTSAQMIFDTLSSDGQF